MLQRVMVLILALVLPVQGMATPHSHAAAGLPEPDGHTARPHFHVGCCDHDHHHGHECHHQHAASPEPQKPCDPRSHDDSAVYVGDEVALHSTTKVELPTQDVIAVLADSFVLPQRADLTSFAPSDRPPDPGGGCPLYLRVLSIRI